MKILEITFMAPNKRSGGGLGVYQSIKSLAKNTQVDYIGPFFEKNLFGEDQNNIHIHTILSPRNISKIKAIYRLLLHKVTTSYYDKGSKKYKLGGIRICSYRI